MEMEIDERNSTSVPDAAPPPAINMSAISATPDQSQPSVQTALIPDESFDVPRVGPAPVHETFHEQSLADPPITDVVTEDSVLTFEEVHSGTKRGGRKLLSSDGYSYTVKKSSGDNTYWFCSVRNQSIKCRATVCQHKDTYRGGLHGHEHPADPGTMNRVKVSSISKTVGKENLFRPAAQIVESVMKEVILPGGHSLPNPDNIVRAVNLHRQKSRPIINSSSYYKYVL